MLDEEFKQRVTAYMAASDTRMTRMEESIETNTAKTDATYEGTKEMIEVMSAMKGGFKVLEWLARLAKIITAITAGAILFAKAMGWKLPWSN